MDSLLGTDRIVLGLSIVRTLVTLEHIVYYAPREEKTSPRLWLGCQFTRAVDWPILLPWSVYYFSSHRGRKCHISVSEPGGNEALSVRCEELVYYTTREVKSWPVQSTCKLPPEASARVAIYTCSGVVLFIPMLSIRFFIISGPKMVRVW